MSPSICGQTLPSQLLTLSIAYPATIWILRCLYFLSHKNIHTFFKQTSFPSKPLVALPLSIFIVITEANWILKPSKLSSSITHLLRVIGVTAQPPENYLFLGMSASLKTALTTHPCCFSGRMSMKLVRILYLFQHLILYIYLLPRQVHIYPIFQNLPQG